MRSVDGLKRRLDNLEKRLPQPDVEFEVYWGDEDMPLEPGEELIVIDFVGCLRALDEGDDYERS